MGISVRTWLAALALVLPVTGGAFSIYFPVRVHQDITETALEDMNILIAVNPDVTVSFSAGTIETISEYNINVDFLQGLVNSDKHFDSDDLGRGSRRLIQLREVIVDDLVDAAFIDVLNQAAEKERNTRVRHARSMMGQALHTLQDFYAHTDWVERTNYEHGAINRDLGVKPLKAPPFSETCTPGDANKQLTSAWSTDSTTPYPWSGLCEAPEHKCAHGWVVGNDRACPGLNKDSDLQTDQKAYLAAYFQARLATYEFARDTLQQVLNAWPLLADDLGEPGARNATRLAVCQFMGVADAISTCLTTHTVTVQKLNKANGQPTLGGLVQSSSGNITPAIDCGLLCEGTAIAGSTVTLTAKSSGNWRFVRWAEGGACAGSTSPECSFTVTANQLARPEFIFFDFVVVPLSPRASFLRSDPGDPTLNPIVITLNELGIVPGQAIELSSSGFFSWGPPLAEDARNTNAVFSSTSELLPHTELHRVPGAIAVSISGEFTYGTCTSPNPLPTDIAEDFFINNPVVVTVPTGAHFLFVGTADCAYLDNSDSNGDLAFTIRYLPD